MPLKPSIQKSIYKYCNNHLATEDWYRQEFEFIQDNSLRERLIDEFRAIRFAYKMYEGIEAKDENLIFEVRNQILGYATLYEAIIEYILNTYYRDTPEYDELSHHVIPIPISIPQNKLSKLKKELKHDENNIVTFHYKRKLKEPSKIRFYEKCRIAERLGLIHKFELDNGEWVDLPQEIIEIYSYRNGIHIIAEQRKGIVYELELSKKAYRRMRPFIDQVKKNYKLTCVSLVINTI